MAGFFLSRWFLGSFLAVILLAQAWFLSTSAYFYVWWLDIAMHLAGGLWVGLLALYLTRNYPYPEIVILWLALGLVAIIGISWEFFEFGLGHYWQSWTSNLEDTLADLLADLLGGLAAFILIRKTR